MVIETHIVYPTKKYTRPVIAPVIPLHVVLDHFAFPMDIHNHRFYHTTTKSLSSIVDNLKSSLAEALELYPPVAGTVKAEENGDICLTTEAVGTPFIVDVKTTPFTGDSNDLSPRYFLPLPLLLPSLSVKLTQFSCGTIVLATAINHFITDLCGSLDFIQIWAKLSRKEDIDYSLIPSDWSHTPARFFNGLVKLTDTPPGPYTVLPVTLTDPSSISSAPPEFKNIKTEFNRWRFTKSSMGRLKRDLSPSIPGKWISSGDALVALLAGAITRAREDGGIRRVKGRSSLQSQVEAIGMAADGRDRAPGGDMVGGQYFGNFNILVKAVVSRSDLLSLTCESASRIAIAIRSAIQNDVSPESIGSRIAFFENPKNNSPPGRIIYSADLIFTNWCKFNMKGVAYDFGWGEPFLVTDGATPQFLPGFCLIMEGKEPGDVSVLMTAEEEAACILRNDPMLNTYAIIEPKS